MLNYLLISLLFILQFNVAALLPSRKISIADNSGKKYLNYQNEKCFGFNFRCEVITNMYSTPNSRYIYLYLDDEAFSEKNLRFLFEKMSKQYPLPQRLTVSVTTNYEEFIPPLNNGRGKPTGFAISEQPDRPDEYDYHQATFYRRGEREYFDYYPKLKTTDYKTVILKRKKH